MNLGILAPGKESSEYKVVLIALAISACWILGLDVQPFVSMIYGKETADLIGQVTSSHPRGGWQAVVGMWFGISSYVGIRGWLKAKCPVVDKGE